MSGSSNRLRKFARESIVGDYSLGVGRFWWVVDRF